MKNLLFLFLILLCFSCGNNSGSGNNSVKSKLPETATDSSKILAGSKFDLENADSIEVYFYKDPTKQNQFTRLFVTDTVSLGVLVENLNNQPDSMKECPHDGKIFFYRGADVFKTIYIATADSCRYFAYAINANKYFVPIDDSAFKLIQKLKAMSR